VLAAALFLGGLAGAGSVIAAGAQLTGRPVLTRTMKSGCAAAAGLSLAALVHDLGRPGRFLHMLRTVKPTSPMSIGSWLLSAYGPAAGVAGLSDLTGVAPAIGGAATVAAAAIGPAVASYTAALVANTAVPAWQTGTGTCRSCSSPRRPARQPASAWPVHRWPRMNRWPGWPSWLERPSWSPRR
jgi:formate-dependent nitrite reductase membrane component NrfD